MGQVLAMPNPLLLLPREHDTSLACQPFSHRAYTLHIRNFSENVAHTFSGVSGQHLDMRLLPHDTIVGSSAAAQQPPHSIQQQSEMLPATTIAHKAEGLQGGVHHTGQQSECICYVYFCCVYELVRECAWVQVCLLVTVYIQ
jgi:hypothetical protein